MVHKFVLVQLLLMFTCAIAAQDPTFSQFYNSPLYLNPAFSGCAKNDFRVCLASRVQWMSLQAPLQYYSVSADLYHPRFKASTALIVNRYNEGYLKTTQASFIGTRSFGSNEDHFTDWFLNFAIQLGYGTTTVDRSKLLFPDQITQSGPTGLPSGVELRSGAVSKYFDASAGFLFTYHNWMIGAAGYHLTEPNNGLIGSTVQSRLPSRVTGHLSYVGTYNFSGEGTVIVKPTTIVNLQGTNKSLMIGSLFDFSDYAFEFGVWYKNNIAFVNNHSISVGVNIKLGKDKNYYHEVPDTRYRAGLSYDAELNRPGAKYTSGSTELGILFEKNLNSDNSSCPKPFNANESETLFPWIFH